MTDATPIEYEFICEVCETTATLTDADAYDAGWDYPPFIGAFGVVSPRTCPDCGMVKTVWWALMMERKSVDDLSEKQRAVLKRITEETPH